MLSWPVPLTAPGSVRVPPVAAIAPLSATFPANVPLPDSVAPALSASVPADSVPPARLMLLAAPTAIEAALTLEPLPMLSEARPARPTVSACDVVQAPPPVTLAVPIAPLFRAMALAPVVVTVPAFTESVPLPFSATVRPLSARLPPAVTEMSPLLPLTAILLS